jgi:hypothetical protein
MDTNYIFVAAMMAATIAAHAKTGFQLRLFFLNQIFHFIPFQEIQYIYGPVYKHILWLYQGASRSYFKEFLT